MTEQFPLTGITPIPAPELPKPISKTCLLRYEKILGFIDSSTRLRGKAPTAAEVAKFMGYSSRASAIAHLANMVKLGLLERSEGRKFSSVSIPKGEGLTDLQRHALFTMKQKGVTIYSILKEWPKL